MNETSTENLAVIERQGDRLMITIAPLGVRAADEQGAWGLLGFAIFATFAVVALTMICIILAIGVIPLPQMAVNDDSPPVWLMLSFFWLVVACLWLFIVHRGRRGAVLMVSNETLSVIQSGLFGDRRRDWRIDALVDIRAEKTRHENDEGGEWWTT